MSTEQQQSPLVEKTIEFVKENLSKNDASHDWYHAYRVMKLAVKIAKTEGNIEDLELVQLAALLHDIGDYKYSRRFEFLLVSSLYH
jgi:uncharacterized protein